jgi:hypothetical protein
VNIMNKQSQKTDRGWFSSLGVGREAKNYSPEKKKSLLRNGKQGLGIELRNYL